MKSLNFCCVIIVCFFMVACQPHDTKNKTILHAEAILFSSPDSSLILLTSLSHPEMLSKADYAAWCLNYTHAVLRLNKDVKSDSLIRISINYYKSSKLIKQSGTAYYLLGCIQRKLQKNKEAMEAFKQAEYLLEKTNENKLKGLVDFNIGYICIQDELYNHSLNYFKKSLKFFHLSNDIKYQAYAYHEISDMYVQLCLPFDSIMHYSNLALKLSKEAGDSLHYYSIVSRQGVLLYDLDYARSKEYILKGYRFLPENRSYYAAILSYTYSKLNMPDSAGYYLHIAFEDSVKSKSKKIIYLAGALLAKGENNYKLAFYDLEKAYTIRDTVFQQSIRSQLYRIDKQYDLTVKETENVTLKIDNRNKVIVIGLLIIIVLVGLIIFLMITNRYKKKKVEHRIEKELMDYSLKVKQTENSQKKELLLSKLESRIKNTLQLNRLKMGLSQHEKMEDFMKEISTQSILSDTDWQYYITEVNQIFDKKISILSEINTQLTQPDVIVITLICLRLDISDCCSLLNMTKNAMYHRRKIIKERIGINKSVDLEEWIADYLA